MRIYRQNNVPYSQSNTRGSDLVYCSRLSVSTLNIVYKQMLNVHGTVLYII